MNVVDLPELRQAAQTVLTWSDHPTRGEDADWAALADAMRTLRAAAGQGRLARIVNTLDHDRPPPAVDDALRDLADLASLPRPGRVERADQLRLPL
ncbi:MAG: hypothetical protein ACRDY6_08265 [Acidimicrobiia bacterium]